MEDRDVEARVVCLDNEAALQWSLRLFVVGFVIAPLAIWAAMTGIASTEPGFSATSPTLLVLSAFLGIIVLVGYLMTLQRTPQQILVRPNGVFVLKMWLGGDRVLRDSPQAYFLPLDRYPGGMLSRADCELVELHTGHGRPSRWIVKEGLLDNQLERLAGHISREGPRVLRRP